MGISFFIFLIISCIKLTIQKGIISYNLESYKNYYSYEDISSIYKTLEEAYVYSNIKIGSPECLIETRFSFSDPYFSMLKRKNINKKNNLYDTKNSKSFKNITCLNKYYIQNTKDIYAKENFRMIVYNINNKKEREIEIKDLNFVLGGNSVHKIDDSEIYYLLLGLQVFNKIRYTHDNEFNFISNLKQRDIIENYIWFIYYEEQTNKANLFSLDNLLNMKQTLLIGDFPHEYKPNKFSEKQIFSVYSNYLSWILNFKSIYFYTNNTKFNTGIIKKSLYDCQSQINFNDFLIYAPYTYLKEIKKSFFEKYISRNICHIFLDDEIESYYCDKSANFNIEHLKEFPALYFEHNELNFTFEFTYKDLFIESGDKYVFLVVNMNNDVDDWFLGNIFLKKYQLFFSQDSKIIGFYNPNINIIRNEEEEHIKENNFNYLIIITIGLSLLLFICLIIIFCYVSKNYKNKKKRANELDDDYDYNLDTNIN